VPADDEVRVVGSKTSAVIATGEGSMTSTAPHDSPRTVETSNERVMHRPDGLLGRMTM
jgi:hypothetical protein